MGTRIPLLNGEIYHVYNRGTEKRKIFLDKQDYERFLALLYVSNGTVPVHISNRQAYQGSTLIDLFDAEKGNPLVDIAAYCLMQNHFHLLLHQREENGISRFMQKLTTAYTMYFNIRRQRDGALFQGKFKSQHVKEDRYLKYLLSYIHLNPRTYSTYPYSSYVDYMKKERYQNKIVNTECVPKYFKTPKQFSKELKEWATYRDESIKVEP